jgi:hypothetical protein
MDEPTTATQNQSESRLYAIRIKGQLHEQWATWFAGMILTFEASGETLLTGPVVDQAALYGLLRKVRDLGMPLISVMTIEPNPSDAADIT